MKSVTPIRLSAIMMAAAFLFAGCEKENENTVDNQPVKARITSVIDGMATRASGTAWAAGDRIGITATKADGTVLFTNMPYVTTEGDGVFTPDGGEDFYFGNAGEVTFTAYYPFSGTAGELPGEEGVINNVFTSGDEVQKPENQPQIDFLFANAKGSSAHPDVQLRFRHCMSRIVLNFLPGDGIASLDEIYYELFWMNLFGIFNTLSGTAEDDIGLTGSSIRLTVPYNDNGMSSALILFPQSHPDRDREKALTLTMRGTNYEATFRLPENKENNNVREIVAGHTYTYNVKINNTSMTITPATISNWEEGGSENIDSTNN